MLLPGCIVRAVLHPIVATFWFSATFWAIHLALIASGLQLRLCGRSRFGLAFRLRSFTSTPSTHPLTLSTRNTTRLSFSRCVVRYGATGRVKDENRCNAQGSQCQRTTAKATRRSAVRFGCKGVLSHSLAHIPCLSVADCDSLGLIIESTAY